MTRPPPRSPLFPYTPLFRSDYSGPAATNLYIRHTPPSRAASILASVGGDRRRDRKSTRLNSSHLVISYAVFCLKKKKHIMVQAITTRGIALRAHSCCMEARL